MTEVTKAQRLNRALVVLVGLVMFSPPAQIKPANAAVMPDGLTVDVVKTTIGVIVATTPPIDQMFCRRNQRSVAAIARIDEQTRAIHSRMMYAPLRPWKKRLGMPAMP
jgi:hypothetical protein